MTRDSGFVFGDEVRRRSVVGEAEGVESIAPNLVTFSAVGLAMLGAGAAPGLQVQGTRQLENRIATNEMRSEARGICPRGPCVPSVLIG